MNGLIMGSCRGMYSVAARGMGPRPEFYGDIDHQNGFTMKSAIIGMMLGGFWYAWTAVIWMYGPDFMGGLHDCQWIAWEPDEICIINLYAMYIPMFIALIVKDQGRQCHKALRPADTRAVLLRVHVLLLLGRQGL